MNRQEREDEINEKCRAAGCNEKLMKKHAQLFVFERWDPHPPAQFVDWLRKEYPTMPKMNPAAAWNSDHDRQLYYKWIGEGQPEAEACQFNKEQLKVRFRAAMAQISSRLSSGHEPTPEDTRRHGYAKRK